MCSSIKAVSFFWRSFAFCENSKLILAFLTLKFWQFWHLWQFWQSLESSCQRGSAVGHNCLAGNVGAIITCQHHRQPGNLIWLPDVLNGLLADHVGELLFILPVVFAQYSLDQ